MASGAHVRVEGLQRSDGGVVALPDLGLRLGPGLAGLLGPNGAARSALLRIWATRLPTRAGTVRVPRRHSRITFGRRRPWRDPTSPTLGSAAGTALERRLSRQLIAAGPSVRRLKRGATLVKQGAPGSELFSLWRGAWRSRWTASGSAWSGPGAVLGELAVLEHDLMAVGVVPARLRDRTACWPWPRPSAPTRSRWRPGSTAGGSGRRWRWSCPPCPSGGSRQVQLRLEAVPGLC